MQLHNRYFVSTMTINGEKSPPFSGSTLNLPPSQSDFSEAIINHSRRLYTIPREEVDAVGPVVVLEFDIARVQAVVA